MLAAWPVSSASSRRAAGCQTSAERPRPPEMASENTALYATCRETGQLNTASGVLQRLVRASLQSMLYRAATTNAKHRQHL